MKKLMIALGLVAILLVGGSYVFAGGPGSGPGVGPKNCPGPCGAANLTPDQQTKLQDLRNKHRDEVAPLREKMISLRQELRALWSDSKTDPKVIQGKEKDFNDLRDLMREKGVQFKLEARTVLTPEQISARGAGCGRGGKGFGPGRGRF